MGTPGRAERGIAVALCFAVAATGLLRSAPSDGPSFAPSWIPFAAAALAAAAIVVAKGQPTWVRLGPALLWSGLLLMVWAANGLPLDLLRLTPLMPFPIDWAALTSKTLALAAAVVLARIALARPGASTRPAAWYGYAAFVLALPYPALRAVWALGATPGLAYPGAAGHGLAPLLLTIPWLLAAALSLLLVSPRRGLPRRWLLVAGWSATTIVAMIGPAAVWSLVAVLLGRSDGAEAPISMWVFTLFYGSWFFWAIAAGAATRSYQLRTAVREDAAAHPPAQERIQPATAPR